MRYDMSCRAGMPGSHDAEIMRLREALRDALAYIEAWDRAEVDGGAPVEVYLRVTGSARTALGLPPE